MTSLVHKPANLPPQGQDLIAAMQLCKEIAHAPFYQKLGPGGVLAIYMTARELGIPFMFALNGGLHNINGKVTTAATTMATMIINAGHEYEVLENTDTICRIRFKRNDRPYGNSTYEHSFTIDDAKKAKLLGKDNWQMYIKAMLFNRCMSAGSKIFLPDVMMNVYCFGEIPGDAEVIDSQPFIAAQVNDQIPVEKPENVPNYAEIPQIEEEKSPEDPEFIKCKAWLDSNEDYKEYIEHITKVGNMTTEEVYIRVFKNQDGFDAAFNKWYEQKTCAHDTQ